MREMSKKELKTKDLIKNYLLNEGLLRENLPDPESKIEFGFTFTFPPGQETQRMSVFKPINKNFIILILRTQIPESHVNSLKSLKEESINKFFMDLRKFFIIKGVYFRLDIQNHRYEINEQIFTERSGFISKNTFFKSIKKLYFCFMYSNLMLEEYIFGKTNTGGKSLSGFDFSFYS